MFHSSFSLQGKSFKNTESLLSFTKELSQDLYVFLCDWFDPKSYITVHTSGSTGTPKPIQLKKEQMKNSAYATGLFFNLPAKTEALCCLPTQYIAGKMMVIRALTLGWHLDFTEPIRNPLKNALKNYHFCAMVPLQVQASLNHLNCIKKLIIGGGVVSPSLQLQLQKLNTQCFATYGMTETITHIAVKPLNHAQDSELYQTLPNIKVYQNEKKCLIIEAPSICDQKIHTHDIVQLHSPNSFKWLGRYDNVINSGGIKLHPEQIELKLAPSIQNRFFVCGMTDEILGEKLILIVEGKKQAISLKKLNRYETPKEIYFIDHFIETDTKKIHRKKTLNLIGL